MVQKLKEKLNEKKRKKKEKKRKETCLFPRDFKRRGSWKSSKEEKIKSQLPKGTFNFLTFLAWENWEIGEGKRGQTLGEGKKLKLCLDFRSPG